MDSNTSLISFKDALIFVVPIIVVIVTNYLTKRRELNSKITEQKRKVYEDLLTYLQKGFFDKTLTEQQITENKNKFFTYNFVIWLYGSNEVILALNKFLKSFYNYDKDKKKENETIALGSVQGLAYAMRRDVVGKCKNKIKVKDFEIMNIK